MSRHNKQTAAMRTRTTPKSPTHWGAECSRCPLRDSQPVFGDGPEKPLLAIVGEAPGQQELQVGIPFIGRSGEWLEDRLALMGKQVLGVTLRRNEVLLTNACLCFPPGGDMKAFLQRAKKSFKEQKDTVLKDPFGDDTEKLEARNSKFSSPIDCCRPRLMYELGIPRCAGCGKWDVKDATAVIANGLPEGTPPVDIPSMSCTCPKPRWTKPPFGRVKAVLATGNAALESIRGTGGIMEKQMYVFENEEKSK